MTLAVSAYTTISQSKSKIPACYVTVTVKTVVLTCGNTVNCWGHSKRAGIPLVSSTLAGNGADDPLYVPTWHKLESVIGHKQFVYIADCKAASQGNRAQIDAAGGTYCFPLPETGRYPNVLRNWVLHPPSPLQEIRLPDSPVEEPSIGVGFEMELGQLWQDPDTEQRYCWSERYLVVRSPALQQRQLQGLHQRLHRAEQALAKVAAHPHQDCCELINQVQTILKRHRVSEFFAFEVQPQLITRYRGRGRPSAKDTTRQITEQQFTLQFQRQEFAISQAEALVGWRIYVTNAPVERLTLPTAVAYYREQWQLERSFHRFKRGNLPALPIYLQNEQRIIGLMFLLTIARASLYLDGVRGAASTPRTTTRFEGALRRQPQANYSPPYG